MIPDTFGGVMRGEACVTEGSDIDKQSDRFGQAAKGRRHTVGEREVIVKDGGEVGVPAA